VRGEFGINLLQINAWQQEQQSNERQQSTPMDLLKVLNKGLLY